MGEPQTWRELLGKIVSDSKERQRIAGTLGITPITLARWISGESSPRPQNLRRLLEILPEHREQLAQLFSSEFKGSFENNEDSQETLSEIPVAFYERVLHSYTQLPTILRFTGIIDTILQQITTQLDPDRSGIAVVIVKCVPPADKDQKIRSLHEVEGRGTPPWSTDLNHDILLGAESLAGYTLMTAHPAAIQDVNTDKSLVAPLHSAKFMASQAAHPIFRSDGVAGCLLVSSTQPHFFTSTQLALIAKYAELMSIAFDATDFYAFGNIDLRVMPSYELQASYFSSFRSRVTEIMQKMTKEQKSIPFRQAEEIALRQIEQDLLDLAQESFHKSDEKLMDDEVSIKKER
jgi:transcriptional regulator with XRE-family HTH domain